MDSHAPWLEPQGGGGAVDDRSCVFACGSLNLTSPVWGDNSTFLGGGANSSAPPELTLRGGAMVDDWGLHFDGAGVKHTARESPRV